MSTLSCQSTIRRVCVHARGALITRSIVVGELKEGPCELLVEGITPDADPGSFRVELLGGRQVTGLQIAHQARREVRDTGSEHARCREIRQQLKGVELSMVQIQHERDLLRSTNPNLNLEYDGVQPLSRVQDGLAAGKLLHELLGETEARLLAIAGDRRGLQRELAELSSRLQEPPPSAVTTAVTIALGPELSPVDELSLSYVVQAARWWPSYTARLAAGGREGTWFLNAVLAQQTGEDWTGVELALSTADLVSDARLPELKARRLGRAQPTKSKGYRPPPEGLSTLFQGYERALAAAGPPSPVSEIQLGASLGDPFSSPADPFGSGQVFAAEDHYEDGDDDEGGFGTGAYRSVGDLSEDCFDLDDEEDGCALGAPPPPPAAAPSIVASFASNLSAGMPPPSPKSRPAQDQMKKRSRSGGGGAPGGSLPPPPPLPEAPLEPADAWLDFDRLVLPGRNAGARERGRLKKSPPSRGGSPAGRQSVDALSGPPHARDPRIERGSFDFQFESQGLADVNSGLSLTRVGVREFPVAVRQVLTVVPVADDTVYREAELVNPLEVPLLGGPVEVYLDGSLLTTTGLGKVGRGGVVRFGLGAEERVKVARNVRTREETSGLIGKTTAVEHSVTLEIRSSLTAPITLRVLDRVPVLESGEDDLSVKLLSSQPKAKTYDQKERGAPLRGGLSWELELAAGERQELSFSYALELPAKREVVGGNRRD